MSSSVPPWLAAWAEAVAGQRLDARDASQVLWTQLTRTTAESAGTHPASTIAPGALTAAKRAGLDLEGAHPRSLSTLRRVPARVITVCDQAHEELEPGRDWLHWSIVDPVPLRSKSAFNATVEELRRRIGAHLPADRVAS